MRILFIASRFPYPPIQGDRVRGYHQLRILSRQHQITLIAPAPEANPEDNLDAVRPFCQQIHLISSASSRKYLRLMRAPFTTLPFQTLYAFDPRIVEKTRSLLQRQAFDLVYVQLARMAPVAEVLGTIPKVLDLIDALSLNMERRAQRENGPLALIFTREAKRLRQYERDLTRQYDQLIVSSPLDREVIGSFENISVIANGVDIDAFRFDDSGREPNTVVFTGRMGYFPNADAAIWFTTEVFPLVRHQVPQVQFVIVGADPTREVQQLADQPGVSVTGYVSNIQDYLHQATVAVAPMQAGSGMQFKVIEAMACGVPVVATPYAMGGVEANHGEHLMIGQDPHTFADHVVRLLKDPSLRRQLALNARRLVEEKYSWERSVSQLEGVFRQACGIADTIAV